MTAAAKNSEVAGVNPMTIFGMKPDSFKNTLQTAALQFGNYIRTTFVADLDNVQLFREHTPLDITDLITR